MIEFPNKKYNIIYADPPWGFHFKNRKNLSDGAKNRLYETMKDKDIINLPIQEICKDDCILFLWVMNSKLELALQSISSWGFEYKTLITWIKTYKDGKPVMGMGYYFRGCTEHIIFGVKGKMKCLNKITRNMFKEINPRLHSQKPAMVRDLIVNCSGDLPRIELFARPPFVKGWDHYGNE